jgi:hypothetical protein
LCKFFRNYQSPQQVTQDITVVEALHAAWATPGLIPAVVTGAKGREERVMSAQSGFANPIREVIRETYHVFGANAQISCLLNIGSGFRGAMALNDDGFVAQGAQMDCERIARDVKRGLARLNVYHRLSVDRGLEGWGSFGAGFGAMKSHVDEYLGRDEPNWDMDQCVAASIKEGRVTMERICKLSVFEKHFVSFLVDAPRAQETRSSHGIPPLSAYFVMRKKPMNALIKGLVDGDTSTQRIMVISGLGGSGKTQLGLKFARDFQERYERPKQLDLHLIISQLPTYSLHRCQFRGQHREGSYLPS